MPIKTLKLKAILLLIYLVATGCASDPKAQDDTFLKRFNGAAYDSQSSVVGIPLGKRRQTRSIKGQIQCNPGLDQVPINHANVELLANGKIIDSTFTDRDGRYSLVSDFEAGTSYLLKISTTKWSQTLFVKGSRGVASDEKNEYFVNCGH